MMEKIKIIEERGERKYLIREEIKELMIIEKR